MTRRKPDFFTYTPRFYRVGTPTEFGVVTRLVRRERVRTSNGGTAVRWAVYCENRPTVAARCPARALLSPSHSPGHRRRRISALDETTHRSARPFRRNR